MKNKFYRESLSIVLNQIRDFRVVNSSNNFLELFGTTTEVTFDIIILDADLASLERINEIHAHLSKEKRVKILVLCDFIGEEFYKSLIDIGADDIIQKHTSKKMLEEKIKNILIN